MRLSERLAQIITSPDKQDAAILLVAPKGYGKSYSAITIGVETARAVAALVGGEWTDYFPVDYANKNLPNVGIIETENVINVIERMRRYQIGICDDVGIAANSRKFYTQSSILLNDLVEQNRIDNTLTIWTVMDNTYVDKVLREIVPYFAEISEKHHDKGFNVLKVFENKKMFRARKQIYPHLIEGRNKMIRYVCPRPPDDIARIYDHMREKITAASKASRIAQWRNLQADETNPPLGAQAQKRADNRRVYGETVKEYAQRGLSPYQISRKVPLSRYHIEQILNTS